MMRRTLWAALLVLVVAVPAAAQAKYQWRHVALADATVPGSTGESALARTLNALEQDGWEVFAVLTSVKPAESPAASPGAAVGPQSTLHVVARKADVANASTQSPQLPASVPSVPPQPTPAPAVNSWVLVNGAWVLQAASPASGCATPLPSAGWACVNGGWLPPGHPKHPGGS